MTPYYAALAAAILGGIGGQILLKAGADGPVDMLSQLLRPATVLGLGLYAASAILYIVALRRIPVSIAFPSVSVSYVIVALISYFAWSEPLGWPQLVGIGLICGGVVLLYQG